MGKSYTMFLNYLFRVIYLVKPIHRQLTRIKMTRIIHMKHLGNFARIRINGHVSIVKNKMEKLPGYIIKNIHIDMAFKTRKVMQKFLVAVNDFFVNLAILISLCKRCYE